MSLTTQTAGCTSFDKAAIMHRAHSEGRFALRMCRTLAERREQLSHWLRKAWAAAKAEAADLQRAAERAIATRSYLAARAAESVALAASYGSAAAIRQEIEAEHYRQHFNGVRIETLRAALAAMGA